MLLPGWQSHFHNTNIFIISLLVHFSKLNDSKSLPSGDNLPVQTIPIDKSSAWSLLLTFHHPFIKPPLPLASLLYLYHFTVISVSLHSCNCLGTGNWGGIWHKGHKDRKVAHNISGAWDMGFIFTLHPCPPTATLAATPCNILLAVGLCRKVQ